jgi:hypothetical protein
MNDDLRTITNGVKLLGEAILPGTSLLMDGKLSEGAAHAVVGIGARLAFGPIGALVVAADSFSKSINDKNLWEYAPDGLFTRGNEAAGAESGEPAAESAAAKPSAT